MDATSTYVDIVSADEIGDATEADLADYCRVATDWLTEHEGDDLSITVRPPRRGEVCGLYHERAGLPPGRELCGPSDHPEEARVYALIEEAWQWYCRGRSIGRVDEEVQS